MEKLVVFLLAGCVSGVFCLPLETDLRVKEAGPELAPSPQARSVGAHSVQRRYVEPGFSVAAPGHSALLDRIRAKRSGDECEKLQLCKLHARSRQSFFAAYELYFVNKENARVWDHRARSMAECEQRFGGCYYT